jgi:hypothetical protein
MANDIVGEIAGRTAPTSRRRMRTAMWWSWSRLHWGLGSTPLLWGQLCGVDKGDATLNWAWRAGGCDHAAYGDRYRLMRTKSAMDNHRNSVKMRGNFKYC